MTPDVSTAGTAIPPGIPSSFTGGSDTPVSIGDDSSTADTPATITTEGITPKAPATFDPSTTTTPKTPATVDPGTGDTPPPVAGSDASRRIIDANNSGLVFGTLKEGVDAWRASLGYTTDQWGNEITEGYLEAKRPDYVCESLRTFLKNYYKDKPGIWVSLGAGDLPPAAPVPPTPVTTSTDPTDGTTYAADTTNTDVVKPPDVPAADTGTNTSEDVPALTNKDQTTTAPVTKANPITIPADPKAPPTDGPVANQPDGEAGA